MSHQPTPSSTAQGREPGPLDSPDRQIIRENQAHVEALFIELCAYFDTTRWSTAKVADLRRDAVETIEAHGSWPQDARHLAGLMMRRAAL